MNSILVLVVGIGILIAGYVFYGKWLAGQWGVDPKRKTPAFTEEDGVDYVPAKAPVLMGHHFSSIAGAGPINGPIQAAVFGWVPVLLWVLIGGIFFGGVHDYGALFAATTISIIPVLAVYLFFQKQFIAGIAASAVKG